MVCQLNLDGRTKSPHVWARCMETYGSSRRIQRTTVPIHEVHATQSIIVRKRNIYMYKFCCKNAGASDHVCATDFLHYGALPGSQHHGRAVGLWTFPGANKCSRAFLIERPVIQCILPGRAKLRSSHLQGPMVPSTASCNNGWKSMPLYSLLEIQQAPRSPQRTRSFGTAFRTWKFRCLLLPACVVQPRANPEPMGRSQHSPWAMKAFIDSRLGTGWGWCCVFK